MALVEMTRAEVTDAASPNAIATYLDLCNAYARAFGTPDEQRCASVCDGAWNALTEAERATVAAAAGQR